MNTARYLPFVVVILIGIVFAAGVLLLDKSDSPVSAEQASSTTADAAPDAESEKGPKGGLLFVKDKFSLELTIYEKGVPPHFRVYLYESGKPLVPTAANVTIVLSRLGRAAEVYQLSPAVHYLTNDREVEEPHSFEMVISADYGGRTYRWGHSQIEGRVEMDDTTLASSGVEIATAGPAVIQPKTTLPGEVIFNEHKIVHVVPRLPGMVVTVQAHHGQKMSKGDVLLVIESPALAELRSQYLSARSRLQLAEAVFKREETLWREKITAKQDYLVAKQQWQEARIALQLAAERLHALGVSPEAGWTEKNLARYELRSPIDGIIIDKAAVTGEAVPENKTVFIVADISTVWVAVKVFPSDLHRVHVGQKAVIRADAQDLQQQGTVIYVTTLLDNITRTAIARVELDNHMEKWRPGMFVKADLLAEAIEVPVAVSLDAIQILRDSPVVFGRYGDYLEMRPLKLGVSDDKLIEVVEGLSVGEQYAIGNSYAIKAELGKAGASHDH